MNPATLSLAAGAMALAILFIIAWWRYERPRPKTASEARPLRTFAPAPEECE